MLYLYDNYKKESICLRESALLLNALRCFPLPDYAWASTGVCVDSYRTMRKTCVPATGLCVGFYRTMRSWHSNHLFFLNTRKSLATRLFVMVGGCA